MRDYLVLSLCWIAIFQVQFFFASVKALSRKEVHYGAYATSEQVMSIAIASNSCLVAIWSIMFNCSYTASRLVKDRSCAPEMLR